MFFRTSAYPNFTPPVRSVAFLLLVSLASCSRTSRTTETKDKDTDLFPEELVLFAPYEHNPIFTGTGKDTWDEKIRERGYILREDDGYHLWYTGYRTETEDEMKYLGYATSSNGIEWQRYQERPIYSDRWVEDMMVVKHADLYYMFAEGRGDIAHLLTSADKVNWTSRGNLEILQTNGKPITPGPYGTPTVFRRGDLWYLFYERNDEGIWVATSKDMQHWKNVKDEPVIEMGPEAYDRYGVAVNQIIKHKDNYYAYYHGTPTADWSVWNTNIAVSEDLINWKKYPENPILEENKSSGILVHDGRHYRLYTLHDRVDLHFPFKRK